MEEIDSCFIPSELLFSINDMIRECLGESFSLSFYPSWELSYEIHGFHNLAQTYINHINDLLLSNGLPEIPVEDVQGCMEWFLFISYPRMECRNSLLHTVMIHEVAHLIDYRKDISSSLMDSINLDEESLKEVIRARTGGALSQEEKQEIVQSTYEECTQIMHNWIRELVCDLVAVRIAGPTYFFAFIEASMLANVMRSYSSDHPASSIRLKYLLDELDEMGYFADTSELKGVLEYWKQEIIRNFSPPSNRYHNVAYRSVIEGISILQSKVRECIKRELAYTANRFDEASQLASLLEAGIAPSDVWEKGSEKNNPVCFISLLNAGWMVYYTQQIEGFYSVLQAGTEAERSEALNNLNELLLKAIEGSEILKNVQVVRENHS
jgi:hypothetical protein